VLKIVSCVISKWDVGKVADKARLRGKMMPLSMKPTYKKKRCW
jgi:hypothetical protein